MKRHRWPLILLCALALLVSSAAAQRRPLKVMVLCDMEGVSGATDERHTDYAHPAEYAEGRKSLTADVNAAIAGLKAAGATDIVVVDGHGSGNTTGPDVLEDQLLPPAKVHYRDTPFSVYMDSYDASFDAIVAVAMHAGAGNREGFLSHTDAGVDVEYTVNGVPFNESMILAMGAARLKIPLIMVSGDDQLEKEIHRNMPWVEYAAVKHAVDRARAESFPREEVSRRIEAAARRALEKLDQAKLPDWPGPYRFALTFQDEEQAGNAALLAGAELLRNGRSVQIRSQDFEEGFRRSARLIGLAEHVQWMKAFQAVIDGEPNAAQLRVKVGEWLNDRWMDRLPKPAAPPSPSRPRRYWGAQ